MVHGCLTKLFHFGTYLNYFWVGWLYRITVDYRMPHALFVWNDEIVAYLSQHGVTPDEFEEVVLDSDQVE